METLVDDPELKALTKITEALADLDEDQRRNVLLYIRSRYGESSPRANFARGSESSAAGTHELPNPEEYSDIGDFFDATDPQTEAERVLVGAYWVQVVEDRDDFESFQVNKHLKNLGHPVSNITRAFDSMMTQSPRLVIQTQKSGKSKQARKRYKITREGMKRVRSMLSESNGASNE
jgi:hypothetical protein